MTVTFDRLLEFLRDSNERGIPLHPGFPPTRKEQLQKDQAMMMLVMAEQIEANRLAIEELRRSIQSIDSRTTGTPMIGGGE